MPQVTEAREAAMVETHRLAMRVHTGTKVTVQQVDVCGVPTPGPCVVTILAPDFPVERARAEVHAAVVAAGGDEGKALTILRQLGMAV